MTMPRPSDAITRPSRKSHDREHLAHLYSLSVLAMIMNDGQDESGVLRLALSAVGTLGPCRAEAGYLSYDGAPTTRTPTDWPGHAPHLDAQVRDLNSRGGPVTVPGCGWAWAYALPGGEGALAHLVISAPTRPTEAERFLTHVLAQQTAAALANAVARRGERDHARELRRADEDRAAVNARLTASVAELEYRLSVHEALSEAATDADAVAAIAEAVHRLTGHPVAIDDRFGNRRACAGPGHADSHTKPDEARHESLLRETAQRPQPARLGERLVALARHQGELLGSLTLIDPRGTAGEREEFALDQGCAALTLALAHLRNLAEVELRLRRGLADDLLAGTDNESAYARAAAVGHDLHGPLYLAALRWEGTAVDDAFVRAADRAATGLGIRSLQTRRPELAVLVLKGRPQPDSLHRAMVRELGSPTGSIGVGGRCDTPDEIPRSFQEALRALEVRRVSGAPNGTTAFDELGLFRILGHIGDHQEVEHFVREWLGPLLDYDSAHRTDLVGTLSQYFEYGGNYDRTAAALTIHRSTLRYRLQRIREVGGQDLTNVDTRLNLHIATRVWNVLGGPP